MVNNLAVDRSKQAKIVVYSSVQYNALPHNRVDLEGYDTRYTTQQAQEMIKKERLTKQQRKKYFEAQRINRERPYDELKEDLRTTENVISIDEVDKWKANPNHYDIKKIDTQPVGLISKKANYVRQQYTNSPRPISKDMPLNKGGSFHKGTQEIKLNKRYQKARPHEYNMAYAHETGHAFDWKNTNFKQVFNMNERKELKNIAFAVNPVDIKAVSPTFAKYRLSKVELYADFFSGYVEHPKRTQEKTPLLSSKINKSFPTLTKELINLENSFLDKHIKRYHKSKKSQFGI
jgi:hypothetical protein